MVTEATVRGPRGPKTRWQKLVFYQTVDYKRSKSETYPVAPAVSPKIMVRRGKPRRRNRTPTMMEGHSDTYLGIRRAATEIKILVEK